MAGHGLRLGMFSHAASAASARSRLPDFIAMTKPRPMSVVLFTAIAGVVAAPGAMQIGAMLVAVICIALGGGGAAVLNMWFERDLDRRMVRTANRPIAAGRVTPGEALSFAVLLIGASLAVMAFAVNVPAAAMLALTIGVYGILYTMLLKRTTPLNVVIGGGLASVLTPLTGWVAATGSLSWEAVALFFFLVPWTAPHVWSQGLVRASDYANAGVPMMPVVAGSQTTRGLIVAFTALHVVATLVPPLFGMTGALWLISAVVGGSWLMLEAVALARIDTPQDVRPAAWRFYRLNSLYVVTLLAVLMAERGLDFMYSMTQLVELAG